MTFVGSELVSQPVAVVGWGTSRYVGQVHAFRREKAGLGETDACAASDFLPGRADDVVLLDFATERSVVQTRFVMTALAVLRASLGDDLGPPIADAETALELAPPQRFAVASAEAAGLDPDHPRNLTCSVVPR